MKKLRERDVQEANQENRGQESLSGARDAWTQEKTKMMIDVEWRAEQGEGA